jgi:hypothetical protein
MDGIMQLNKKSKKDIINKLRMILDDPHIKDDSIKNKNLISLQKKLTSTSKENLLFKENELIKSDYDDSLEASVVIHRIGAATSFEKEDYKPKETEISELYENPFENEELYEIELTEEVPEFIEIKDEKMISDKEVIEDDETLSNIDSVDDLPEWETVETEISDIKIMEQDEKISKEIPEWEPITSEQFRGKKLKLGKKDIQKDSYSDSSEIQFKDVSVFDEISSIDNKIAELLVNYGYSSLDELNNATIKDLINIKGIRRKTAKKIKQEIKKHFEEIESSEFENFEEDLSDDDFEKDIDEFKDSKKNMEHFEDGFFKYGEYSLYRKEIILQSDKKRIIHFFCKEKPDDGEQVNLPEGYEVKINKKTGVPYISRKK